MQELIHLEIEDSNIQVFILFQIPLDLMGTFQFNSDQGHHNVDSSINYLGFSDCNFFMMVRCF